MIAARPPHQRGFTLLELLIAIAIFALLAMGTYRMLQSVLQSDESTRRHERQLRELTRAMAALDRDLLQVIPRTVRDTYGEPRGALLGGDSLNLEQAALELTRSGWRNPLGAPRAQLQRVRWQLRGDVLQRLYWPVLDQAVDTAVQEQQVLKGVSDLRVRFLDIEGNWQPQWPPARGDLTEEQLLRLQPQAVELTLTHQHYGELRRLYRLPDSPPQQDAGGPVVDSDGNTANDAEGADGNGDTSTGEQP